MNHLQERYSELVSLTEIFLMREYALKDKIVTDPQTYKLFQTWAKQNRPSTPKSMPIIAKTTQYATNPPPSPDPFPPETQPEPHPATPSPGPGPGPAPIPTPGPDPKPRPPEVPQKPTVIHKAQTPFFTLEPLKSTEQLDTQDIKKILKEQIPSFSIIDTIPTDEKARRLKNSWQMEQMIPPVLILSFNEGEKPLAFLKNVAQAINLHLMPARVISGPKLEQERKWESVLNTPGLRLVIASDYGLYLLPELMKHYKEAPRQAKHYLNQIPLLLLSDPSLYLKEPSLKAYLWRAILNELTVK